MIKAIFLDFYGTVVHEDGAVIKVVNKRVFDTGKVENMSDIDMFWGMTFKSMFTNSYGTTFKTQRYLELKSLENTISHFESTEDAKELSELMFKHWIEPPIFQESKEFFDRCPLPIYIVSNIDIYDITRAIKFHDLKPNGIFTSEDAHSYKPRKELFELALCEVGLSAHEVVHIGDSISSDIKGASALGINTIWLNRFNKPIPEGIGTVVSNLLEIMETDFFSKL